MTTYGVVVFEDLLTKRKVLDYHVYPLQRIYEDIEMYQRYISDDVKFSCKIIGDYSQACKMFRPLNINTTYEPNAFNVELKRNSKEYAFEFNDEIALQINLREEKDWVMRTLRLIGSKSYDDCIKDNSNDYKIFGSLCHQGFVNSLFDNGSSMYKVLKTRQWINVIGNKFNPEAISSLEGSNNTIYVSGLYSTDVRNICTYCEIMFHINRYEVAKLFTTKSPDVFLIKIADTSINPFTFEISVRDLATLYAHNGNYETSLKYHKLMIEIAKGHSRFVSKLEHFIKYYEENGTSVLFPEL